MGLGIFSSPWLVIWSEPRKTFKAIIETDPKRGFWVLASIYTWQPIIVFFLLLGMQNMPQFNISSWKFWVSLAVSFSLSPLIGAIYFYVAGGLFFVVGKILKGGASYEVVRTCLAWSSLPLVINYIAIFFIFAFSEQLITTGVSSQIFLSLIFMISSVWSLAWLILFLKEAQNFSFAKAIVNYLLSIVLVVIAFLLLTRLEFLQMS